MAFEKAKMLSPDELEELATIRKFRIVQIEGPRQVQRETNLSTIFPIQNNYRLRPKIQLNFKKH